MKDDSDRSKFLIARFLVPLVLELNSQPLVTVQSFRFQLSEFLAWLIHEGINTLSKGPKREICDIRRYHHIFIDLKTVDPSQSKLKLELFQILFHYLHTFMQFASC